MKKVFLILGAMILTVVVAVSAVLLLIDPNQFKPVIVDQTKQQTGLDLVIDGDLKWSIFPSIGFSLGKTELKNPQGFSHENLLKIDHIGIDVSLLPLLSKELIIGNLVMDGAEIRLETLKDGRSNLDSLKGKQTETVTNTAAVAIHTEEVQTEDLVAEQPAIRKWKVSLTGVSITDALLDISNAQTGSHTRLYDVGLSVSEFQFNQPTLVTFTAQGNTADTSISLQGSGDLVVDNMLTRAAVNNLVLTSIATGDALPQSPMVLDIASSLTFDTSAQRLAVILDKLSLNQLTLDGKADVIIQDIPELRFSLHSSDIDVDAFLGADQQSTAPAIASASPVNARTNASSQTTVSTQQEQEPDLSVLLVLDIQGDIQLDKLKAGNAQMQDVALQISINRGIVELSSLAAELYAGSIQAKARLDARQVPAHYTLTQQAQGIQILPLLTDVAGNKLLEGTGNIEAQIKGAGLTPAAIKQNLTGTVEVNLADGAVNGVNIARLIRTSYAQLKGQKAEETGEQQKTDFTALTATIQLNKGLARTSDLSMQSPLLRINGAGEADYIAQTTDFLVKTSLVGTLEGQGGKELDELKNVTIPLRVKGAWSSPKFSIQLAEVLKDQEVQRLKQKAEKKAEKGLKKLFGDKIKEGQAKELTDKLFNQLFK